MSAVKPNYDCAAQILRIGMDCRKMIKEKSEAVTKPWRIGCESADESVADKKCEVIGDEISEKSGQVVSFMRSLGCCHLS